MSLAELVATPLGWLLRGRRADPSRSVQFADELAGAGILTVSSTSFDDGAAIARKHSGVGRGQNVSPELHWSGMPEGTRQVLVIIEDPDVPLALPVVHTIALVDPAGDPDGDFGDATSGSLREGALTVGNLRVQYVPAFRDRVGYQGPRPLPGHGVHHYGFHVYALDTVLDADALAGLDALLPQAAGHVLAAGVLTGWQRG
ncbi:YbhB/YbcL family Raf kinase inhibitor-like protein [Humibacter ginsenosidimutans]|uniref:YbhB/YbcL family Raf kinase inhibitor-like protein n=1 Tax=Humibacter ginsenosidimutans TaxID=2599293 RepID=A0A5B8LYL3_9MICO|nr:YbhB/YbcL family Raf kinase inhibitor-like protein [Humibacter ginsenosidimutans]QDZ13608.1 YbhB/YbcL family Raf kinase inhibitor-like protein [Humibacter ginsenosidimutans]